jgi:hypothetical protein
MIESDNTERYQVSFVLSAGNYRTPPLLDYPRQKAQSVEWPHHESGRQCPGHHRGRDFAHRLGGQGAKGGSALGLLASRRRPESHHQAGPGSLGGSCATDVSHQAGVTSLHGAGCGEDLGRSFSTPLVSRALAETYHHITPTPSPVLARGVLTHHARDPRTGGRVPDGEENYFGFGRPMPPPYCLERIVAEAVAVADTSITTVDEQLGVFALGGALERNDRSGG